MLAVDRLQVDDFPSYCEARGPRRELTIPLSLSALLVLSGVVFSLSWGPWVHHVSSWTTPPDLWATYRDAHFVGWGDLGGIYSSGAALVTFPGIVVVLAPLAMLTGALGLTEGYPLIVPHPTAWLVLGPLELILGCIALFGSDALARRLGLSAGRRAVFAVFVAVGLWSTIVLWGHPEDAIATGIACYAVVATLERRPMAAGWLVGVAVCFQPLVLLVVPLVVASMGIRSVWHVGWRAVAPSAALLLAPLASSFGATTRAIVEQPNFANLDHRTPWTSFAPTVSGSGRFLLVAAGPFRSLSVLGAVAVAIWFRRRLTDPAVLVWLCSVVLVLRCLTESVMVAYYLWPPMVFAGALFIKKRPEMAVFGATLGAFVVVFSDRGFPEWTWWFTTEAGLVLLVLLAAPSPDLRTLKSAPVDDDHIDVVRSGVSRAALEEGFQFEMIFEGPRKAGRQSSAPDGAGREDDRRREL
jgi:hypothetical protein